MGIIGQLSSQYGNKDSVGILRDADLALGIGYEHPELAEQFRYTRDCAMTILSESPEQGANLRNTLFSAKDIVVQGTNMDSDNSSRLKGADHINFEYQRLILLRQMILRDPSRTLQALVNRTQELLQEFPISSEKIINIGKLVKNSNDQNFDAIIQGLQQELGHVGVVSFLEGCITEGKNLDSVTAYVSRIKKSHHSEKEKSMEYWDFYNLGTLAATKKKILENNIGKGKSFVLSGGSGNAFTQLAIMQKYVEDGGRIKSISGTSAGSAMAILVAYIGNDAQRIKQLMNDIKRDNNSGKIPEKLHGHEQDMKAFFDELITHHGLSYDTKFSDLKIPVVVNAGRQYSGGEQEIVMGGEENVMDAIWASQNIPKPHKMNNGFMGLTPVNGVNLIDYAANERGNPSHWISLLGEQQKDIIDIDVGYSSERGGSPIVRLIFSRATSRDIRTKIRIENAGGFVIDMPLDSGEGYKFPSGAIQRFFDIGCKEYNERVYQEATPNEFLLDGVSV